MNTYELGAGAPIRHYVKNETGELADATVTLTVIRPDLTTLTPTMVRTALGTYDVTIAPVQVGTWTYKVEVSGAVIDVRYGRFRVVDPAVPPTGAYACRLDLLQVVSPVPDNAEELLLRASRDVDRALLTAVYDATDPAVIVALRDAVLEQIAGQRAGGDTAGLGVTKAVSGFSIGKITVQKGSASTSAPTVGVLVAQAYAILAGAGLTGQSPTEWTWWP